MSPASVLLSLFPLLVVVVIAHEGEVAPSREVELNSTEFNDMMKNDDPHDAARAPRLGACAWVRNAAPHLEEWVAFHTGLVGVEHIFVFDVRSTDGTAAVLRPFIKRGVVTLLPAAIGGSRSQQDTHSRCTRLANVRGMEWVVFLDADEFAVPQDTRLSLPQALLPFTANQLCLLPERHLFGSCGRTRHAALELETYTHRKVSTPACHACSKGTTSERTRVPPPKLFINLKLWKSGLMAVSSFGVWSQVCAPQSASVVRVHHYLRSLEDYQRRMRATLLLTSQRLTLGRFFDPSADAHCDLHMEPYFDPLREMLRMEERPAKADRCTPCPTMATAQRGQRSPEVK